ncbi:glycosyltransferase family 4 protein [Candidatus Poribacteria bacterium]|nr:glycosyltransferase family 4 protein [Candidatus Poribacteria bacterium]
MRIGLSTSSVIGTQIGGLGVYIRNLLLALQRVDHDNEYIIFMPHHHRGLFPVESPNFHIVDSTNFSNQPFPNVLWHLFVLPLLIRQYRIDVLHLPEVRRIPAFHACPMLLTVHDLVNFRVKGRVTGLRLLYRWFYSRALMSIPDRLMTPSESTRHDLAEILGYDSATIPVIPYGIYPQFRPYPRDESLAALAEYKVPARSILCVSRLEHPQKNHVTLLRAFAKLKLTRGLPHKLIFVGPNWNGHEVVDQEIDRLGLAEDVILYGYVPHELVPHFYNVAEVCVYPTLYEGFGLPALEALACGVPLITSRVSSLPEVVGDAGILFDPYRPDDLAEALARLIDDENLRTLYVQKGLARAAQFSWDRAALRTIELYSQLHQEMKQAR